MKQKQKSKKKQKSQQSPVQYSAKSRGSDRVPGYPYLHAQVMNGNHGILGRLGSEVIQTKLTIGSPNDKYEREADRIAEYVVRLSEPEMLLQENSIKLRIESSSGQASCASSNLESHISRLRGSGQQLPDTTRTFFENRFDQDFSQVRIHTDDQPAKTAQYLNAKAYTVGRDIVFAKEQYAPQSTSGKRLLAHELAHVVQQKASTRKIPQEISSNQESVIPGTETGQYIQTGKARVIQLTPDYPIVNIWRVCSLHRRPDDSDPYLISSEQIRFLHDQNVTLILSRGEWLEVEGEAFRNRGRSVGTRRGWIRIENTSLAPASDVATENTRAAQDLDDLLDEHVLPSLGEWRSASRTQGNAYLEAYNSFSTALQVANQQASARAEFYGAILSVVCVGGIGFIGNLVQHGYDIAEELLESAAIGGLEDAIQQAAEEVMELSSGGWFTRHVSREMHPQRYGQSLLRHLDDIQTELIRHVGTTKARIRRLSRQIDRAHLQIRIYNWWRNVRLRNTPPSLNDQEEAMTREFLRGFWRQYILQTLATRTTYVFYGRGHAYIHPEQRIQSELTLIGITRQAGIESWPQWEERALRALIHRGGHETVSRPGREAERMYYTGSEETRRLAAWARRYVPTRRFGGSD